MTNEANAPQQEIYAPGYSDRMHARMTERTGWTHAAFILPYLRPGMRLLDIGCGPGSITLDLAEHVAPGEVIGIDREPLQLERARALAVERGVANARFATGDAYALPFPGASFDAVFANAVLMWLRDPLAALKEFRRVLRPAGVAGISDISGLSVWEPATPF